MNAITTIGLLGFVFCGVLLLLAFAGEADGMWGDTQSTVPTLKRFLVRARKVFAVIGLSCGLVAVLGAVLGS